MQLNFQTLTHTHMNVDFMLSSHFLNVFSDITFKHYEIILLHWNLISLLSTFKLHLKLIERISHSFSLKTTSFSIHSHWNRSIFNPNVVTWIDIFSLDVVWFVNVFFLGLSFRNKCLIFLHPRQQRFFFFYCFKYQFVCYVLTLLTQNKLFWSVNLALTEYDCTVSKIGKVLTVY